MSDLNDLMNQCAGELPKGFGIEINVELGAGDVHLVNSDGQCVQCFEPDPEQGLMEGAVRRALATAKRMASNPHDETVN